METFETPPRRLEPFDETGAAERELVGQTEIRGFEQSGVLTGEELARFLSREVPPSHLEGCPRIVYKAFYLPLFPQAGGSFNRLTHEILVFKRATDAGDPEVMRRVITHEVGHNVHENLLRQRPELAQRWADLHTNAQARDWQMGLGFVSAYARGNVLEDFAESYRAYIFDPELLKLVNPEKYEFMRQEVFAGREYPPRAVSQPPGAG